MIKAANVLGLPEVNATVIDERLARNLADRLLDHIDEFADAGWERIHAIIRRRQGSSRIGSRNRAMKKAIRQVFGSFIVEEVEIDAGYFCAMPTILVNMETDQRRLGFHTFRIDKRKEPMEGVLNCEITYHVIWRFIQRNGFSVEASFRSSGRFTRFAWA